MRRHPMVFAAVLATLAVLATARLEAPAPDVEPVAIGRGPTVVLVHGLGSRAADWLPLTRDLGRDHRVIALDLPGHGFAPLPAPLTLDSATDPLLDLLAGQPGPVVLVAHSAGGLVAVEAALRVPDRVAGLVLVESALTPQFPPSARREIRASLARDPEGTLAAVYRSFGRDSVQGEQLAAVAAQVDRAAMLTWIDLVLDADLRDAAAGLRVPVLAVLAPHSWPREEAWSDAAQVLGYAGVPVAEPVRIEDCGHFLMLDRPSVLADVVRRFVPRALANSRVAGL